MSGTPQLSRPILFPPDNSLFLLVLFILFIPSISRPPPPHPRTKLRSSLRHPTSSAATTATTPPTSSALRTAGGAPRVGARHAAQCAGRARWIVTRGADARARRATGEAAADERDERDERDARVMRGKGRADEGTSVEGIVVGVGWGAWVWCVWCGRGVGVVWFWWMRCGLDGCGFGFGGELVGEL